MTTVRKLEMKRELQEHPEEQFFLSQQVQDLNIFLEK
jgi:hypothetical protein